MSTESHINQGGLLVTPASASVPGNAVISGGLTILGNNPISGSPTTLQGFTFDGYVESRISTHNANMIFSLPDNTSGSAKSIQIINSTTGGSKAAPDLLISGAVTGITSTSLFLSATTIEAENLSVATADSLTNKSYVDGLLSTVPTIYNPSGLITLDNFVQIDTAASLKIGDNTTLAHLILAPKTQSVSIRAANVFNLSAGSTNLTAPVTNPTSIATKAYVDAQVGTADNIYNSDGTLTAERTVTQDSNKIIWSGGVSEYVPDANTIIRIAATSTKFLTANKTDAGILLEKEILSAAWSDPTTKAIHSRITHDTATNINHLFTSNQHTFLTASTTKSATQVSMTLDYTPSYGAAPTSFITHTTRSRNYYRIISFDSADAYTRHPVLESTLNASGVVTDVSLGEDSVTGFVNLAGGLKINSAAAKGTILAGNATIYTPLAAGTDGQILIADSSTATGLRWGTDNSDNIYNSDGTTTAVRTVTIGAGYRLAFQDAAETVSLLLNAVNGSAILGCVDEIRMTAPTVQVLSTGTFTTNAAVTLSSSVATKAYVDGQVAGVDTIYTANGSISAARTVTIGAGVSLTMADAGESALVRIDPANSEVAISADTAVNLTSATSIVAQSPSFTSLAPVSAAKSVATKEYVDAQVGGVTVAGISDFDAVLPGQGSAGNVAIPGFNKQFGVFTLMIRYKSTTVSPTNTIYGAYGYFRVMKPSPTEGASSNNTTVLGRITGSTERLEVVWPNSAAPYIRHQSAPSGNVGSTITYRCRLTTNDAI